MAVVVGRVEGDSYEDTRKMIWSVMERAWPASAEPRSILIKPNLCYYWDSSTGQTVGAQTTSHIIDYLREKLDSKPLITIGEADASAMKTKHAFRMLGYDAMAREKNVKLTNLSDPPTTRVNAMVGGTRYDFSVSDCLLQSDMILNLSKLKYHRTPGLTCSLKNMFGAIAKPHKFSYHRQLDRIIVAINKTLSDLPMLCVVDGLVALGKYPLKIGTILAGTNALEVDSVAARIMGVRPQSIGHLNLAQKEGLGHFAREDEVICINTSLNELRNIFPKQNRRIQNLSWWIQLTGVRIYCHLAGDVLPPLIDE